MTNLVWLGIVLADDNGDLAGYVGAPGPTDLGLVVIKYSETRTKTSLGTPKTFLFLK